MIKRSIVLIIICLFSVSFIFAQDYVDIANAKTKITQLEDENNKLQQERQTLEGENQTLISTINKNKDELAKLEVFIEKLKAEGLFLYNYSNSVVDKSGKEKAVKAYEEYRELLKKLRLKQDQLKRQIKVDEKKYDENKDKIETIIYKVRKNIRDIQDLNKSIAKTQSKNEDVDSHITTFDSYKQEAGGFVQ